MILVTGGTGLVGSHLLAKLTKTETSVRAIYRSKKSIEKTKIVFKALKIDNQFEKIEWYQADLLDYFELEKALDCITHVYHAAAKVSFSSNDFDELMKVNVEGTAHLVNLALEKGIQKLCYVSSVASLGSYPNNKPTDEEAIWQMNKNTSNYSVSKYYAENEVWRASEEGLNVVIVNPATIIGFGDWQESSTAILKKVYDGLYFYPSGANGFVSVNDVVKAMVQLMNGDVKNERFLLVSKNMRFIDLFTMIAKGFNRKAPQRLVSKKLAQSLIYLDFIRSKLTGKPVVLTKESVDTAYRTKTFSSQKIREQLGFEFEDLELSIKETCGLYKKNKPQ